MTKSAQSSGQVVEFGSHLIKRAQWQTAPDAISWWPETPLWTAIFITIVACIIGWTILSGYRFLQKAYVRQTRRCFIEFDSSNDLVGMADLLRRFSQQHWPLQSLSALDPKAFSKCVVELTATAKAPRRSRVAPMDLVLLESAMCALLSNSYQQNPELEPIQRQLIKKWFEEVTC